MTELKIAHLGFIQATINRMSNNSFMLKGWCVTLIAALLALSSKDSNKLFVIIPYFPIGLLWLLDSYYLFQERLYRELYNQVAEDKVDSHKLTMNTNDILQQESTFFSAVFSKTIIWFYVTAISLVILAIILLRL